MAFCITSFDPIIFPPRRLSWPERLIPISLTVLSIVLLASTARPFIRSQF